MRRRAPRSTRVIPAMAASENRRLFLLDGMALAYRAYFAFANRPIRTARGFNTSVLFGFTQTLLDLLEKHSPTHWAVAFDTPEPTERHRIFPDYKALREAMPEDLSQSLPHLRQLLEAWRIPTLECPGYEADDVIGTLVRRAEPDGFDSYMVSLDKDLGQLVTSRTFLYKVARFGEGAEVWGVPEVLRRWSIRRPAQVTDILALMGDASDNIPGVPGVGEKTAIKLISQYDTLENLLDHTAELKGKLRETLEQHADLARLSKRLATIHCAVPTDIAPEQLRRQPPDDQALRALFSEFEFNSLGRRLFGPDFRAGHGLGPAATSSAVPSPKPAESRAPASRTDRSGPTENLELFPAEAITAPAPVATLREPQPTGLKTIAEVPHDYRIVHTEAERRELIAQLTGGSVFSFDTETTDLDPKRARLLGLAFSWAPHTGAFVPVPADRTAATQVLAEFQPVWAAEHIEKVGHNLKFDLLVLRWHGVIVAGKLFDTMLAHCLFEPDQRHGLDYLAEVYLGYSPIPLSRLIGDKKNPERPLADVPLTALAEYATEDADVSLQLRAALIPLLTERGQQRVFYEIEAPLIPVLADMEYEGIRVDAAALQEYSRQLAREMSKLEAEIYWLAGTRFNLNSPRQLGQILFEVLRLSDAPKKTRTGQYATDETTLLELAGEHPIVQRLLEYRDLAKLKSTYADALPEAIFPDTGRVHTTFYQAMTATGRLSSQNPNLQNIPIRTERGREIRRAFVPRSSEYQLLSADYSQIELRILAALARETRLLAALASGVDVHTATAAQVFGVAFDAVTPEMRRQAKMVNYGIAYGISSFGLAQRLGIPRSEGAAIIEAYFRQFPAIRQYMDDTVRFAREHGYVQTVTGRRRYLPDIRSANATVRNAAERNAINMPIQGTAADLIKIAMRDIHAALRHRGLRTRLLLQVHDEVVFDLYRDEREVVLPLVRDKMSRALDLGVPLEVELGVGDNWLEAH